MNYTRNEIKAGLMVVISAIILVLLIFAISGLELLQSTKDYKVLLKHTGGVVVGSLVRYGGMEVGKVSVVKIADADHSFLEIGVRIAAKTPIKTDSEAFLSSVGLLGDFYIEISPGSLQAPELPAGSQIKSRETAQFTQLTQPVEEIGLKLQTLIERTNDLINDQSRQHIASMIATMDSVLILNAKNVNEIMTNLNQTTAHFEKISGQIEKIVANENINIEKTYKNIDELVLQTRNLTRELQQTSANLNQMLVSRDQNLAELLHNEEKTTENLEQFTQTIKDRPWNLIRKSEPKPRELH